MVTLPLVVPVAMPEETGPGAMEAPEEETLAEAEETGIGMITAGPVIVGIAEAEVGAD